MSFKIRFYEILNGVVELKNDKNNFYLTDEKYNIFLSKVKEAKSIRVGLLQTLIVDPKIYQNSLLKARTAKIIRGLTKQ
jgi:hypothetical protein